MTNPYVKTFYDQLHSKFSTEAMNLSYADWVTRYTTLNKRPFSFKDYWFQKEIINDMSPDVSVIKISQTGITEIILRQGAAFATRNQGTSVLYVLPNDDMRNRVSNTRLSPLLSADEIFNAPTAGRPIRRTDLLQIGSSFLYMLGGSEAGATSIPGDFIIADEVDLADAEMLALYNSRLQNSDWKLYHRFSTPTFENAGIDAHFKVSNQKMYLCRCPSCNHWNDPRWSPEHIHIEGLSHDINDFMDITEEMIPSLDLSHEASFAFCTNCGSRLNLVEPEYREWVPKHPSRTNVGYKITPWAFDRLPVAYILNQQMQYARSNSIRRFWNTVLGESYEDSSARLSELEIRAVMGNPQKPEIGREVPVVVGLDMGITCHLVLMALTHPTPVVFSFETIPERNVLDRIEEILVEYNVVGGCVDRYPYTPLSNEIRDVSNGRIVPVEYSNTGVVLTLVNDELGNLSHARGHRTTMLDDVAGDVRKKRITYAGYGDQATLVVTHLRDQVRIESNETSAVWKKTAGQDHYAHSLAYARFAMRVHNLLLHRSDDEPRELFGVSTVRSNHQNDAPLGMYRSRRLTM